MIYRVACTIQLLLFFFIALLFVHPWVQSGCKGQSIETPDAGYEYCKDDLLYSGDKKATFFKMPVIALVMITILNDGMIKST